MLTFLGPKGRFCDRVTRRSFLRVGSLAVGGLTLPRLLRAEDRAGVGRSHKSVIMVYLSGGLAHQDTFDLKPDAPPEARGEFRPIATRVPGVRIGELLPLTAGVMDKVALIRSVVGLVDEHSSYQNLTGHPMGVAQREGRPNFGSVVAHVRGPVDPVVPPFVDLTPTMQHRPYNSPGPGYLGRPFGPVKVDGEDVAVMKLRDLTGDQLDGRRRLLEEFDRARRVADSAEVGGMDTCYRRAFDVLTSSKLIDALNVEKEPAAVRERYGRGSPKHLGDGAPLWNDQLLMARRLVEAGARCVTVAYGFWDTHGQNFRHLREHLPTFDRGISALIEDVYARGLDRDVTVVIWGEFGRSPKVNKDAGRDHWSRVNSALLSGGGMPVGQVIGSTDSAAAEARDQPVHYQDILATAYRNLGIDPHAFVHDVSGRPVPILPGSARPVEKLL